MIFEKASTRTRLSFEAGMQQPAARPSTSTRVIPSRPRRTRRGRAAQVISRMSDIVMIRTFEQSIIERFAEYSASR